MLKLLLALTPEVVTVRKFWSEEDTSSDGVETRVIRPARWITMIKMPDGKYIELFPHELETLQERHTIVWEREATDDAGK